MSSNRAQPPVAIVVSRYNERVTSALLDGAIRAYEDAGGSRERLAQIDAPGAYELIGLCRAAAASGLYRGVVALGCVIKGQTRHDRYICDAVSQGLANIIVATGTPIGFGLLTVRNQEQALARAGGDKGNKGADAMLAVLESIAAIDALGAAGASGKPGIEFRLSHRPHDKTEESI